MNGSTKWLLELENHSSPEDCADGLILVEGYDKRGRPPEEVSIIEKAKSYNAHSVFFEAGRNGRPPAPQALIFVSEGPTDDPNFAELHKRLWSWGGVPLVYRKTRALVQLFRCAHEPDFVSTKGEIICKPVRTLEIAGDIASADAWWDASRLRNGTLWDDPNVCKLMLSASKAAHKRLIDAVGKLYRGLNQEGALKKNLRRRLLILSLLIAYLEERRALLPDYFGRFLKGATKFFQVLADGKALVALLADLEERFNGNVFTLDAADRASLKSNTQLARFARLVEAHEDSSGQLTLWQLYSFKDLPVELISHIYQLFLHDSDTSVYTPPFLVRMMLEEALSWERINRLQARGEIILDPACGSGIFLVEAYKRLVLHWRSRNQWSRPRIPDLKKLLKKVHGVDLEQGAVELAAFSLCLALCDALEPEEIRSSIKLFPPLAGRSLHNICFFQAKEEGLIREPVGVVVGNPPFKSKLNTEGSQRSYDRYKNVHGSLPDKQLAYLFLHEAMEMVAEGGVLSMLQQYNFLYNQQSIGFRSSFMNRWNVRELLDFVSVRGLFQKGGADTKVIVVVAEATPPKAEKILHATFRRSGLVDAEQGFDIDHYDLHLVPRDLVRQNGTAIWRANLLGGGRVLAFINRLKEFRTLAQYAEGHGWDFGEGFIDGKRGVSRPAQHIIGKPVLPSEALTVHGIDTSSITTVEKRPIEGARTEKRFTPPMLLVREHMDLPHEIWDEHYLTYRNQIVGFCAPRNQTGELKAINNWLTEASKPLQAYSAATSTRLFSRKATALSSNDICSLPYPAEGSLDLSANEQILVDDIVDYQRDLVRLGDSSVAMLRSGATALPAFKEVFLQQINTVYKSRPLQALQEQRWAGCICQPFVFGKGKVDWSGSDELKNKLDALLVQQTGTTLRVTRIARMYDGNFVFLLKPDRLRYWLRSIALRDADEILADLRMQGF